MNGKCHDSSYSCDNGPVAERNAALDASAIDLLTLCVGSGGACRAVAADSGESDADCPCPYCTDFERKRSVDVDGGSVTSTNGASALSSVSWTCDLNLSRTKPVVGDLTWPKETGALVTSMTRSSVALEFSCAF